MASSPGSNDTLSLGHQHQQLEPNHYNINNTANGSSKGMPRYQQDDAIVPTYGMEDDSMDEDDEYGSYAGETEHHPHTSQEHSHDKARLSQNKYSSAHEQDEHQEDVDEVEYSTDYMNHHRQQREQREQRQQAYKSQAMNIQHLLSLDQAQDQDMSGDDSQDEEEYYQQNPQHDPNRQHLLDTDMHGEDDDDDDFDDDEEEGHVDEEMMDEDAEDAEDAEEGSDAISLTEEDIDFSLVYAFHTFVATQEGQASVVRNDSLVLLEDSNVYWWLVRVLKSGVIGYIPAENIETPFERLARLNTYRNVATTAPSSEWGTFDEHVHPLDPATLQQRAANRRSVIFSSQNDYMEASETEWTDEEDEDGEWYGDEDGEEGDELDDDEELQELEAADDDDEEEGQKSAAQLEAERGQQEAKNQKMDTDQNPSHREDEDDEDIQVTNRYRKPLLDEDDLFARSEPRVISLTPAIARDDSTGHRTQTATGKVKKTEDTLKQRSQSPQQQRQQSQSTTATSGKSSVSPTAGLRSSAPDSDGDAKKKGTERKDSKVISILGKNQQPTARKSNEHEQGLSSETSPGAAAAKKPSKFKSLFSVGKTSAKDKERKEKEKQEKERLKSNTKSPSNSLSSSIGSNLFRTRSNSNGSVGSSITTPAPSTAPQSPIADKIDSPSQEFMTLRVYPGNVDFGASLYKTVVITPGTMASEAAHQAVVKFRLAPDGTASTGDFFLTVKGLDGDETVLQPTDKPMAIYQSLTAHLTTPLPANHRLSISSVASVVSVTSTASGTSNNNARTLSPPGSAGHPTLRRSGSGRFELQPSIRFMLNKKIRRPTSIAMASLPTSPTTPTAPQEDFFWVKVICQAQDLPQSMLFLDGMGSAMEKTDPKARGQSLATKAEHWIPMHATSNAGDVVFKMLEKVDIRVGVVDGVPEHVLAAKRSTVPDGLVYEYHLGLMVISNTSKNHSESDEVPLAPQTPLSKCFEEQRLAPIRRSPKADVASMPPHPGYVFFLRKSAKSLQAEMRLVQEQLQQQRQERKVPSPLHAAALRTGDLDTLSSAQPSPTHSISSLITPTSPGPQNRNFNAANAALMNASRIGNVNGGSSSPVRIPRRADSVIMSPTNPLVRANSYDNTSERPSPTPSAQPSTTTPRTPTPDRLQSQQQQQQQQARTRSPSISQGSPTPLARPFQAPSPAPSNLSSHAEQQEGSRPTSPEKSRSERQRATSPSLTHGPSPLSLSTVVNQGGQAGRKGSFASADEILGTSNQSGRLSMTRNDAQGVDIALTKGVVRSSKMTNGENQTRYHYTFISFESGEEIDISEIIEDTLGGGDSDDEQEDQQQLRTRNESPMELENMSRRERIAAAVARASQAVADGKERRRANASSSSSTTGGIKSRKSTDRDRLELVGNSARGTETLLKLERALSTEASSSNLLDNESLHVDTTTSIGGRNLPSPMSLSSSSPPSPTLTRKISDAEVHVASIATVGPTSGRIRSPGPLSAGSDSNNHGTDATPPGPTSPLSPPPSLSASFTKATLLSRTSGDPSSPSAITSPHYDPLDTRSYSPLPRPLQSPSPGSSRPRPLVLQTSATGVSAGGASTASVVEITRSNSESPGVRHNRSRSASTSMADVSKLGLASPPSSKLGLHGGSASESAADTPTSPTMAAWLLTSDYNKGMQELLTLVRAGRSSSVSTSAPSSTKGGLTYGKDGRIIHSSSSTSSPAFPTRQRLLSLQSNPTSSPMSLSLASSSLSSMYNSNTTNHTTKDTQAHDHQQFDDISSTSGSNDSSSMANDRSLMTTMTNTTTTHNSNVNFNTTEEEASSDNVPRMVWTRTDRRLRDVRNECHPEVFECWREVDADLDKVEKELDSLLATVKATIF